MMILSSSVTELKLLTVAAAEHKFTMPISESSKSLVDKFNNNLKTLEQWVTEPSCLKDKGLLALSGQVATVMAEKHDLMSWAKKFPGLLSSGSGSGTTRRRKNA